MYVHLFKFGNLHFIHDIILKKNNHIQHNNKIILLIFESCFPLPEPDFFFILIHEKIFLLCSRTVWEWSTNEQDFFSYFFVHFTDHLLMHINLNYLLVCAVWVVVIQILNTNRPTKYAFSTKLNMNYD